MAGVAEKLGVGVATLYSHVRGQEELRRIAGGIVFDGWKLPESRPGMSWATWTWEWARDARVMAQRYPVVSSARPLAGGQLRYVERVMERLVGFGLERPDALYTLYAIALLVLGVGAQLAAARAETTHVEGGVRQLMSDEMNAHPDPLPNLEAMQEELEFDRDAVFDDLVWFTVTGIARRRGEVLPARPA
jgi:AcrR family transcriptional regulator